MSATDYAEWLEHRREAEVALEDREKKLFDTSYSIECQLELLGKNIGPSFPHTMFMNVPPPPHTHTHTHTHLPSSLPCSPHLACPSSGATGIEDRLQPRVSETIESLRIAGVKVWVLTGDKQVSTAQALAHRCNCDKKAGNG